MDKAYYRKFNDRSMNSSKYHKKDGTAVRAKLKNLAKKEAENEQTNSADPKPAALAMGLGRFLVQMVLLFAASVWVAHPGR